MGIVWSSLQTGIEGSRGFPTDRGPSVSLVVRTPLAGLQTWTETILRCQCVVQWPAVLTTFVCDNGGTFLEQETLLSKGPAPGHVTTDDLSALSGTHDLTIVLDSDERSGLSQHLVHSAYKCTYVQYRWSFPDVNNARAMPGFAQQIGPCFTELLTFANYEVNISIKAACVTRPAHVICTAANNVRRLRRRAVPAPL